MADIRLLERTLASNVAWNKARINFVAKFLVALIQVRSVNLSEVASVFAGGACKASHYKRIQRFLRSFEVPYAGVAAFVLKLLGVPRPWALTLDRTDWYLGKTPLNILVLGVIYKGAAFPLLWAVLPKKGCSSTAERIALLDEFGRQFGFASVAYLCADREFIGKDWFRYLRRKGVACRLRVRANTQVTNARGRVVAARQLFRHCRVGRQEVLGGARVIRGERWYVTGLRLPKGEYVIVVAERETGAALSDYARRWEVETLFGCLKTRGFCLEATHVTDPERLKKLLALVALAFCWAHVTGEWLSAHKPLPIKKHGRKAVSLFRHGLDHLRRILCNQLCEAERVAFRRVIKLLSCT
ncbi:MAG: IS4 family transposase [Acidobacteria bacterium]|nr:IS4 family transposase [Acidobacteriota bacterium]MCA1618639.1 IS4 family transposase [Acidobacteriota bacterium]